MKSICAHSHNDRTQTVHSTPLRIQPFMESLPILISANTALHGEPANTHICEWQVGRLFDAAERYMGMRPRSMQPALRPFFKSRGETDAAAASDSGGASFLGQVSL